MVALHAGQLFRVVRDYPTHATYESSALFHAGLCLYIFARLSSTSADPGASSTFDSSSRDPGSFSSSTESAFPLDAALYSSLTPVNLGSWLALGGPASLTGVSGLFSDSSAPMQVLQVEQVLGPGSTWITAPSPSTSSLASSSNSPASDSPVLFHAFRRTYKGAAKHDSYIWLQIVNPGLLKALKAVFLTLATLYKSVPGVPTFPLRLPALLTGSYTLQIDARAVYVQREALRSDASSPAFDSLLCYVEASFAYVAETITTYPAGTISWHLLWTQLEIGEDLETVHDVTGETRFGKFLISRLSPVVWRDESFSHLVIPASYRQIVKALVTVHAGELKEKLMVNAVEGKGNGLVMAFHGAPGTGKVRLTILSPPVAELTSTPVLMQTLTAEAVAEHLRRPLYVVSAGELGMTAQTLDNQLKNVLEVRQFRLSSLNGKVLILTTNHIKNFGKAFLSRFAIVLRFDELDEPSCRTLWEQFLLKATSSSSSSLSAFDLAHLASFRLNGRDIKHVIQTAQAVALVKGDELGMEHLDDVLRVAKSGMRRE
ncbi:hypothetical protein OF846_003341 [Rhodotorula toruloides]|nr:hypothetical protein OF846_003341 [Rhodotorula toruloides]